MASCDKLDKWALRQQHDLLVLFFFSCNLCSVTSITVGMAAALTTLSACVSSLLPHRWNQLGCLSFHPCILYHCRLQQFSWLACGCVKYLSRLWAGKRFQEQICEVLIGMQLMQWTCKVPARVVRALYFPDFSRPAQFLVTCPRGSFVPISDWSDPATDHLKLETSASWTNFLFRKAPLAQHWALICFYYIYGLGSCQGSPFHKHHTPT